MVTRDQVSVSVRKSVQGFNVHFNFSGAIVNILNKLPIIRGFYSKLGSLFNNYQDLQHRVVQIESSALYQVVPTIHSEDFIYHFVKNHPTIGVSPKSAVDYYFSTGNESANKLIALKRELGITGKTTLLEFASGYGCVTRHLVKHPEEFEITSCDIHQQAINFIEQYIKVKCIGSSPLPEDFQAPQQYGIVFALSFFSHLPNRTWGRWLAALYRSVEPGGHLIFTTHGLVSQRELMNYAVFDDTGFWFNANSEQHDLDTAEYGTAITTPSFVRQEIAKLDGATASIFHEGYWWGHQDVWVVRKG